MASIQCEAMDPASIRSRFEKGFHGQFLKLAKLCITWGIENRIDFLDQSALKSAVEGNNFKAICDFHEEMESLGKSKSNVPDFLLEQQVELVDSGFSMGFLVAYVFLVADKVSARYTRHCLFLLGCARDLHIQEAGVQLGCRDDKKKIRPLR